MSGPASPAASVHVIHQLADRHIPQLHALYRTAWWSSQRTLEETAPCLQGLQLTIGLVDAGGDLAGFTRALGSLQFMRLSRP